MHFLDMYDWHFGHLPPGSVAVVSRVFNRVKCLQFSFIKNRSRIKWSPPQSFFSLLQCCRLTENHNSINPWTIGKKGWSDFCFFFCYQTKKKREYWKVASFFRDGICEKRGQTSTLLDPHVVWLPLSHFLIDTNLDRKFWPTVCQITAKWWVFLVDWNVVRIIFVWSRLRFLRPENFHGLIKNQFLMDKKPSVEGLFEASFFSKRFEFVDTKRQDSTTRALLIKLCFASFSYTSYLQTDSM